MFSIVHCSPETRAGLPGWNPVAWANSSAGTFILKSAPFVTAGELITIRRMMDKPHKYLKGFCKNFIKNFFEKIFDRILNIWYCTLHKEFTHGRVLNFSSLKTF
jgi:hypothetical protein